MRARSCSCPPCLPVCRHLSDLPRLNGTLPTSWAKLPTLGLLTLDGCALSGPLPAAWARGMQRLSRLTLSHNPLRATLPREWFSAGAFPALRQLEATHCELLGTLPHAERGALPALGHM